MIDTENNKQQPPLHINSEADEKLLKEIRHDFRAFLDYWRENRQQMEEDMRFAGGDAFTAAEHTQREADDRPCETPDELSQYVKQTNNNLRQNKRDSKISPASEDATDDDAQVDIYANFLLEEIRPLEPFCEKGIKGRPVFTAPAPLRTQSAWLRPENLPLFSVKRFHLSTGFTSPARER